ncbi:MAG: response regulator transcription factor [Betaproteobacteria bacterium]|nr:response regulator transcription factor [Betaproteobacteria bacterium]
MDAPESGAHEIPSRAPRVHVLLAEDDDGLSAAIAEYFLKNNIDVDVEPTGNGVIGRLAERAYDLLILDLMLPGRDGFEVCKSIRLSGNRIPILMLTARNEDIDHVLGLELGADDFLAKPIQPRVLLARIKALVRRATDEHDSGPADPAILQFGRLRIDVGNREVNLAGARIELSPAEFDLLTFLASNAGKVMQRDEILKSLRGLFYSNADRSVDARLYRLRRRFGKQSEASWKIKTVRPHGYMFSTEPW